MPKDNEHIDTNRIRSMLDEKKEMKYFLSICASCGECAESCFYYVNTDDPESSPAYKALNSLGFLFKRRGMVSIDELEQMKKLIWGKCVLCGRCYCPFGIEIWRMIAWARAICRSQGVHEEYEQFPRGAVS